MYVVQGVNKKMSMYSNWKLSNHDPNPEGLSAKILFDMYNSHYTSNPTLSPASMSSGSILTHSSYWNYKQSQKPVYESKERENIMVIKNITPVHDGESTKRFTFFKGGYKSLDDYTYVRGRGRGKYVCNKCGIRCKKPSMLKKHIRSHTDLRPYYCKYCRFSFKTKGNLTKHMKSKAHQKKCTELGILPVPTQVDETQINIDVLQAQCALSKSAQIAHGDQQDEIGDEDDELEDGDEMGDEDEANDDEDSNSREITYMEIDEGGDPVRLSIGAEEIVDTTSQDER